MYKNFGSGVIVTIPNDSIEVASLVKNGVISLEECL